MIKLSGTRNELSEFIKTHGISFNEIEVDIIEFGNITDEEIDAYGRFTDGEKKVIKEMYSTHPIGFFKNPMCALY